MNPEDALRRMVNPSSIAVVETSRTPGKVGYSVVKNLLESGYTGPVVFMLGGPVTWSLEEVARHNSRRRNT
ncbi:MAG: hypothetical protein NWF13_06370 [Candidatus Bathyarchaeota archaeon]|nr:hypothetical protein [Candidatus Bathyarchaeota archaeon]